MRTLLVTAVLFSAILAGCSSKTDSTHNDSFTCPDGTVLDLLDFADHHNATFNATKKCPPAKGSSGNNTTSDNNTSAPNVLPVLTFKITDSSGAEVNNTTMKGGNLTFSGEGTADSDGIITGMAMSVVDANGTRTVSLFDAATNTFPAVNLQFDDAGRARVSVAVVDDRGGFATLETMVYVDQTIVVTHNIPAFAPANSASASFGACKGPAGALVDAEYFSMRGFPVVDNASWIEASTPAASSAYMAICAPPATSGGDPVDITLARHATKVVTKTTLTDLPAALGVDQYQSAVYRTGPVATAAFSVTVTVHYGPRPAA